MDDVARERRALALLEAAIDLPADARDAWLDRETGGDAALLARVRSLLAAEAREELMTGGAVRTAADDPARPPGSAPIAWLG